MRRNGNRDAEKAKPVTYCGWEWELVQPLWNSVWQSSDAKIALPYTREHVHSGYHILLQGYLHISPFTLALSTVAEKRN